ncbi:RNA-directed DNA polymerase from mobile element jockey-like protein [Aphelenchoides avenae]|nr:RNA-directed DNA polymerase from mobile element jockey-like protein [Aphelenchus avenae]
MYDAFLATVHKAVEDFVCIKPPKGSYEAFPAYIVLKFTRNKEQKMLRTKGSRELFKHIARNVKTKTTCVTLVADTGEPVRADAEKVELLAEHFRSVYSTQTEGPVERTELHQCCKAKLAFLNFFEDDVYSGARKCPMSYTITPDGIPPILLRGCSKSLSLPLAIIFNCSMTTGTVPFQFKQSYITPIPKRPPAVAKNFRPISITSIVARTMERIVRRRLLQFLDEHKILPESQYGFRPKRSVRDALIGSIESWSKAIDANVPVDVIYFDFTAAFDKVYVRPIVETCSSTFVVTTKKEVEQLESVQRRFTKAAFMRIFPGEDLPHYRERCRRMELETLEERRIRSDLILAKKILLGKCGTKSAFRLKPSRTRGGATKFDIPYSRTKMRESTFFVRVASTLSKLNADFVLSSSLGVFKEFVKDLNLSDVCDLVF